MCEDTLLFVILFSFFSVFIICHSLYIIEFKSYAVTILCYLTNLLHTPWLINWKQFVIVIFSLWILPKDNVILNQTTFFKEMCFFFPNSFFTVFYLALAFSSSSSNFVKIQSKERCLLPLQTMNFDELKILKRSHLLIFTHKKNE